MHDRSALTLGYTATTKPTTGEAAPPHLLGYSRLLQAALGYSRLLQVTLRYSEAAEAKLILPPTYTRTLNVITEWRHHVQASVVGLKSYDNYKKTGDYVLTLSSK